MCQRFVRPYRFIAGCNLFAVKEQGKRPVLVCEQSWSLKFKIGESVSHPARRPEKIVGKPLSQFNTQKMARIACFVEATQCEQG
jgi:hypothetical protein